MNNKNIVKNDNLLDNVGGFVNVEKDLKGISADKAIKETKVSRFGRKQNLEDFADSRDLFRVVNRKDNEFVYLNDTIKDSS